MSRASGKRIYNSIESHDQHEDWSLQKAKALGLSARKRIPASRDLREAWWNIGNQGDTGSCVGWALADSVLRYHFVKSGKLRKHEHISVRYIWMAAKEMDHKCHYPTTFLDDAGTSAKSALRVVKKIGALKTSVLPFDGGLVKLKEAPLPQRCRTFEGEGVLQSVRHAVRQAGAIQGMACVSRADSDPPESATRAGTTSSRTASSGSTTGREPTAATPSPSSDTRRTHFIIRNSWGAGWGHKGFAYASDGIREGRLPRGVRHRGLAFLGRPAAPFCQLPRILPPRSSV